jgi:ubiquinone/menaquinone biosynthesis C-methylase UbiE
MQQWNRVFKKEGVYFYKIQEDIPKVYRLFKKHLVKMILDLGCGSGRHTVYFARKGFNVYGIDIAREGVRLARAWLRKEGLKAKLRLRSIYERLPYPDNFFDAVISVRVIHHARIAIIRAVIREVERVLKPNGLIFVIRVSKKVAAGFSLRYNEVSSQYTQPKGCGYHKMGLFGQPVIVPKGHKTRSDKTKSKVIAPRTYIPLVGKEKGLVHFLFTKQLLQKEFEHFQIYNIWNASRNSYGLIGQLKKHPYSCRIRGCCTNYIYGSRTL